MTIIKSKKFILRPFKKGDHTSLVRNINNKKISRNTLSIPYPYKMSNARSWINYNIKLDKKKKKEEMNFVIDIAGDVAGSIGLREIKAGHMAEMSYWVGEKYRGQGIMTAVLKEITKYGFNELKLRRMEIGIFHFNEASKRVAEKAGYQCEGRMRKYVLKNKKFIDALLFAKVR
ncbi:MAG: GNAT family protein [Candidatus Nealsonbacteria bacterium]|nr:GNAT family protein [Candidatus Nealsonbacteria bacterium]